MSGTRPVRIRLYAQDLSSGAIKVGDLVLGGSGLRLVYLHAIMTVRTRVSLKGCLVGDLRFDPVDKEQMRLLGRLSPGGRIRVLLDARELAVGLIRGRLRRRYPDLDQRELNLKVLEELDRADRTRPGP